MKQSNRILKLAAAGVVASLLVMGYVHAEAPATAPTAAIQEATAGITVATGSISPKLHVEGYLAPTASQAVKLKLEEYKGKLKLAQVVANGAKVKAGDVLLTVDDAEFKKALAAAENELKQAAATLEKN